MKELNMAAIAVVMTMFVIASFALQPTSTEASNGNSFALPTPSPRRGSRRANQRIELTNVQVTNKSGKRRKTSNFSWGLSQGGGNLGKTKRGPRNARRRH